MPNIGLSLSSSKGHDTRFCIMCSTKSSIDEYWHQWTFQGIGIRGSTGGSRMSGSGSG